MKKVLWVGDAAVQSGFARNTHELLAILHKRCEVTVLGLNYRGDPHEYPYPIYPAMPGGDPLGVNRLPKMIDLLKPDCVIIQNDPWNFPHYFSRLEGDNLPTLIGVVAVDGINCRGDFLERLDFGVFWTHFALREARAGGFSKPAAVFPLGVDTEFWKPGDRTEARKRIYQRDYDLLKDAFVVLNVNRNQPRKRLDLTIRYFAEWLNSYDVPDAYLHLHVAPTGDPNGYDCDHLSRYYGIGERIILVDAGAWNGITDATLRTVYHCADLGISTTQGEGWGLPTMEGMACGIPQILPKWSAYGEWATEAAVMIPCTSTSVTHRSSVIGGVPDEAAFITALDQMYRNPHLRAQYVQKGRDLVGRDGYRWATIGNEFADAVEAIMETEPETISWG